MELAEVWRTATDDATRTVAWQEIVDIHAQQVYAIGVLAGARQPVVVSNALRNVPVKGTWAWSPGAHFGIYRPDEFWLDR